MVAFLSPAAFDMSHRPRSWFATKRKRKQTLGRTHGVDAPAGDVGCRRAGRLGRPACAGAGGLSEPQHQDDRAVSARRHHRSARPADRRPDQERAERGRRRREQARRRHHARRRAGRPLRSGRLHAPDGDLDHACDQQDALQEAALRPREGFRADRAGRRRAVRADHQPEASGKDARRVHRLRQGQSGAGLWLGRQWQSAASRRRDAEDRPPISTSATCLIAAACRRCST